MHPHVIQADRHTHTALTATGTLLGVAVTDIGTRATQQDAFAVTDHLWAIADGMGGHANGALAARLALHALAAHITSPVDAADLRAAFALTNRAVATIDHDGPTHTRPGTTLVAVAAHPTTPQITVASIGDSRAYLYNDEHGTLQQITHDHEDWTGALTACLGDHDPTFFQVHLTTIPAGFGDRILLATDGVFEHLDDPAITAALATGTLDTLITDARRDGTDNITAALICIDTFTAAPTPSR